MVQDGWAQKIIDNLAEKYGMPEEDQRKRQLREAKDKREQHRKFNEAYVHSESRWVQKQYAIDNDLQYSEV